MKLNEPLTSKVFLSDGNRLYIPGTLLELDLLLRESLAPALDLYIDDHYEGTWFSKTEVVNEN